jgi:hypothetical protein
MPSGVLDAEAQRRAKAFRLGMRDLGWIEGRNIQTEYRFTGSNVESINKHVVEVIGLAPDIIVANRYSGHRCAAGHEEHYSSRIRDGE